MAGPSILAVRRGPGQGRDRLYDRVPPLQCRASLWHPSSRARYLAAFLWERMIPALRKACYGPRDRVRAVRLGHEISRLSNPRPEVEVKPRDFFGGRA